MDAQIGVTYCAGATRETLVKRPSPKVHHGLLAMRPDGAQGMDEADLFLVRVWHQPLGFRASVRRVDEEQMRMFGDAEQLVSFFATARRDVAQGDPGPIPTHPHQPPRGERA